MTGKKVGWWAVLFTLLVAFVALAQVFAKAPQGQPPLDAETTSPGQGLIWACP